MTRRNRVVVIGAGAGGLAAAMDLSARGADVTLIDRADEVGGKMRQVLVNSVGIDAGPTVFTMRWIFEALFQRSGAAFEAELDLISAERLARHGWLDGSQLDLWADIEQSVDAIGMFSDRQNAEGYRQFCRDSKAIFETLKEPFINAQKPGPLDLGLRVGLHRIGALWQTRPFQTYWSRLQTYFSDPRLQQLFGRYATYVGSSPFLSPATLMLIAHVEQDGVWLVDGGMRAVAHAMKRVAERNGATVRLGAHVEKINIERGRAKSATLESGEEIEADAIVFNGDTSALASGLLGDDLQTVSARPTRESRSLSALTWCTHAKTSGFDLDYHSVFFSDAYRSEFEQVFDTRREPDEPTVYICAQDRRGDTRPDGQERLLILVNAPADGDQSYDAQARGENLYAATLKHLSRFGLQIDQSDPTHLTGPKGFNALFPGTGGALYGQANHGAFATFKRPGARSKIGNLYLAGGSTHPGAGVPMATLSGCLAAAALLADG